VKTGNEGRRSRDQSDGPHFQREHALDGLVADGLVEPLEDGRYALPG
jgi:A/G-specific adenine glycosylase